MPLTFDLSRLYLVRKAWLARVLLFAGLALAYFSTLYPWFLWPLGGLYPIPACLLVGGALLADASTRRPVFSRQGYLLPMLLYVVLSFYLLFTGQANANAYVVGVFHIVIFYAVFRVDTALLQQFMTWLSKVMAVLLVFSLGGFFLYIFGFPLPSRPAQYTEFYSFTNYYLFLLDDRALFAIIPRFQSVFLEPTYLGCATALLLQTQRGRWTRWYCVVLLAALLVSFSLAGYAYLTAIIFLNLWTSRKPVLGRLLAVVAVFATVIGGSFVYNRGDNLVHNLILLRLEVKDGELAGNNRTTRDFDTEFESYLGSADVLLGRDKEVAFGDSGYKVFIYEYGFVGLVLLVAFFAVAFGRAPDGRAMVAAWVVALLIFGVDAFVMWYCRFLPLLCTAFSTSASVSPPETASRL